MTIDRINLTVENGSDIRLDKWLSETLPQYSRQTAQNLIADGLVKVNGKTLKKKELLKNGDLVAVEIPKSQPTEIIPQPISFETIFEDDSLLVINKPQGLVVHPGAGNLDKTLVNGLVYYCDDFQVEEGDFRPGIVHRLDKDTSGIILVAKTKEAHFKLAEQFATRKIKKTYLAITIGKPKSTLCTLAIKRHPVKRQEMTTDPSGKIAETHFEILLSHDPYYLIKAEPITGRTHQIRVHLKALDAPIFGDSLYGKKKKEEQNVLQMLHAFSITFTHPITKEILTFKASPPLRMLKFITDQLKKDFNCLKF